MKLARIASDPLVKGRVNPAMMGPCLDPFSQVGISI
jgi:hypothetical protein